jgi:undecaprenyl pyrophosphate phosphatase UppP
MFGVTCKTLISDQTYLAENLLPMILGNLAAFIAGIFAVGFLLKYLSGHSLAIFGWYRVSLATIITVIILLQ